MSRLNLPEDANFRCREERLRQFGVQSPERKELTHCRNFTGRSELLPQAVLHFGQRKALPSSAVTGKPQAFGGRVSIFSKPERQDKAVTTTSEDYL